MPETGATDFTRIGLLASMDKHVGTQVSHLDRRAKHERLCRGELHTPGQPRAQAEGPFPHAPGSPVQIWLRRFHICRASLQSEFECGFSGSPVG